MNENIQLKMNPSVKKQRSIGTSIALFSQDIDNYSFDITFTDLELQAGDQVEVLAKLQGGKLEHKSSANLLEVDGELIARYVFDTKLIDSEGHVFCYVYLKRGDKSADVGAFYFEVDLSELDKVGGKIAEVYDGRYEDLVAGFEIRLQEYRDSLPQASEVRAEIDVILNQFGVDSQQVIGDLGEVSATVEIAEASRVEKESERVQAETERREAETLREENYEQLIDTAIVEADVVEKVDNKVTELTPQINNLTAQLAQTAKQNEVFLKDLGININDFDEPTRQTFLEAQGIDVNYVLGEGNVKPKNTTFFKTGRNLFDKNSVKLGHSLTASGAEAPNANYSISDYIPVKQEASYFVNYSYFNIVFYDASKEIISVRTGGLNLTFTTPTNTRYLRFVTYNDYINSTQLESGTVGTGYEPYRFLIDKEQVEKFKIEQEDLPSLPISKFEFAQKKSNLFDKTAITENTTLSLTTGDAIAGNNFVVSEFIPISPNDSYYIKSARRWVLYDSTRKIVGAKEDSLSQPDIIVPTPSNAAYLRISWYLPDTQLVTLDNQQINKGTEPLPYEPYGYEIPSSFLPSTVVPETEELIATLPPKIYALEGQEINIYFDNIISGKDSDYDFDVVCSVGQHLSDRYTLIPETSGNYPITIKIIKNGKELVTTSSTIIISPQSVGNGINRSILIIGDSTTAQLGGMVVQKLTGNFESDVMDITAVGTLGTAPNLHEGKSGWTTDRHYKSVESSFVFNGVFDFSEYMTTNELSGVDYVVLNLGINDVFSIADDKSLEAKATEMFSQYESMIDSIKGFNSAIKIGIGVTIPPNYYQDAFGYAYGTGQTRARYKRNNILLVRRILNNFENREAENIYLVPIHTNLDTRYNMGTQQVKVNARNETIITAQTSNGGVHPYESGYHQIADVYWYWLKSFEI